MARTLRWTPGVAVPVVIAILACVNVLDVKVPHASLVAGPLVAAGLIGLARLAGLSWQDPGLGAGTWRRGATWAAVEIAAVAVVYAVGAALPLTRNAFRDSRYHLSWPEALLAAAAAARCSRRRACTGRRTRLACWHPRRSGHGGRRDERRTGQPVPHPA
jgi:hypothetical protein